MARRTNDTKKKPIEQYEHKGKQRVNNPPVGLVDAKSDAVEGRKTYAYDPHLDPMLQRRRVFFPMASEKEGWSKAAKNLKAEIDDELIEAYCGTLSLPFKLGRHSRVAVKILDDRGIESLKILELGG